MHQWVAILVFALVCAVLNVFMYMIGWYGKGKHGMYATNKFLPPGFLIGLIWIGIFASLGNALYVAYSVDDVWTTSTIAIIVVASYCLLYPFLTMFMHERYVVVLNLIALLMAIALAVIVIHENLEAFWYVLPLLVWCSYVVFSDIMQYASVIEKFGLMKGSKTKSKMSKY
jgi:tryptophan-rich sensory protein